MKQAQKRKKVVNRRILDDETSDVWCKTDKKPSNEAFVDTTGLNIVIDNPESIVKTLRTGLTH